MTHQNTQRKTQKIETHQTSTEQVSLIFTIETEGGEILQKPSWLTSHFKNITVVFKLNRSLNLHSEHLNSHEKPPWSEGFDTTHTHIQTKGKKRLKVFYSSMDIIQTV